MRKIAKDKFLELTEFSGEMKKKKHRMCMCVCVLRVVMGKWGLVERRRVFHGSGQLGPMLRGGEG